MSTLISGTTSGSGGIAAGRLSEAATRPQFLDAAPPEGDTISVLPRLALCGISESSPLMCLIAARLAGVAELGATGEVVAPPARWRGAVKDTGLQWFDDGGPFRAGREEAGLVTDPHVVDLHGACQGGAGRIWRIVGADGAAVLSPFFGLAEGLRSAGSVSLHLIQSADGGTHWSLLEEVRLSSLQDYRVLLQGLASAVAHLLAKSLEPHPTPSPWQPRLRRTPRAVARVGYGAAALTRRLREYATCELWAIGVVDKTPDALVAGEAAEVSRWIEVPQSEGYVADPIPWPGRSDLILCEHFSHGTGRGSLRTLTVEDGRIAQSEAIPLPVDVHLSYPFAWQEGDRVLCLPEMGASRRQVMYELSREAPPRPVCVVAENVVMADPTLFRANGAYWIAYTDGDIGLYDNLCLLWAERVEGPWHPHRANPVKIDVRSSRGAGALFRSGDKLIRPAQDCSRTYGGAVVLNRVLECTATAYREEPVASVVPDKAGRFPDGLHTFSACGNIVLIDGKRYALDFGVLGQRVKSRLRRYAKRLRPAVPDGFSRPPTAAADAGAPSASTGSIR